MIQAVLLSGVMLAHTRILLTCQPEGMSVTEVKGSEMWWKGPKFLSMQEDTWPETEIDVTPEATLEVRKKVRATFDVPGTESVLFALTPQTTSRLHPSR